MPNFVLLDRTLPDVARLIAAMAQARDAVENRSWSHPQEPTTEEWWADVLADPRARTPRRRGSAVAVERTFYRLADETDGRTPAMDAGFGCIELLVIAVMAIMSTATLSPLP